MIVTALFDIENKHMKFNRMKIFILFFLIFLVLFLAICRINEEKPNIVLVVIDTLRKDHLKCYGYSKETAPHLTGIAQNSIIFKNFYSTASHTLPSHLAVFSSNLPDPKNLKLENSFVQALKQLRYKTYGVSASPVLRREYNFDLGFDHYEPDMYLKNRNNQNLLIRFNRMEEISGKNNIYSDFIKTHLAVTADLTNEVIFRFLEQHVKTSNKENFFLFINYLDPHDPYFPHDRKSLNVNYNLRNKTSGLSEFWNNLVNLRSEKIIDLYDDEILFADHHIYEMLNKLKQLKLFENTVFIITSDHGEILGEHNLFTHNLALYDEEIEIPFFIFGKGINKRKIDGYFSHLDTGEIVLSIANKKLNNFLNKKLNNEETEEQPLIHRHFLLSEEKVEYDFLPLMCKVDLYRLTFNKYNLFYYSNNDSDIIEIYKKEDKQLRNNIFLEKSKSEKTEYMMQVKKHIEDHPEKAKLNEDQIEILRSLGYIK